jgi:hypothetical protein
MNMAVFMRPDKGAVVAKSVKADFIGGVFLSSDPSAKYAVTIAANSPAFLTDKEGEVVKDGIVKAGQRCQLFLGALKAEKYHLMLVPNPELLQAGYLGGVSLIEPYETTSLGFLFKAERQIDVGRLPYLFRLYIID